MYCASKPGQRVYVDVNIFLFISNSLVDQGKDSSVDAHLDISKMEEISFVLGISHEN